MRVVITAGPTREFIDPVRFLSNPSTGRMGFAIAREAARRRHEVILVAGPVALKTPKGVKRVDVVSAREMLAAVKAAKPEVFIATAAVADWRPAKKAPQKLKKAQMTGILKLVRNPDILKTIEAPVKIGFAAETRDVLAEAARKCREKHLAFIVANDVTEKGCGFGTDTNRVTFVYADGRLEPQPLLAKSAVAKRILDRLEAV